MKTKRIKMLTIMAVFSGLIFGSYDSLFFSTTPTAQAQGGGKLPDVIKLAPDSKLGAVNFNHTNHATKNYNIDGSGPIACIECHHTAQPAAEVAKRAPLKTAWPPDRTTTLTAELIQKDPKAAEVITCRSCHVKQGETPKLMSEVPQMKHEGSTATLTLTSQLAFHRNCAGCHDDAVKLRPTAKAPTQQKCAQCHKK